MPARTFAAALCLLAGCTGAYVRKPARTVHDWTPAPSASPVSSATPDPGRRWGAANAAAYRTERLAALEAGSHPVEQVGVGFPVRDWVSGYFRTDGSYVAGEAWDRSSDGE